jgi:hypothetical protein
VLGKEAIQHSLAAHSQWIESITKKMHSAPSSFERYFAKGGSWETTKSVRENNVKQRSKTLKRMGDELRGRWDEGWRGW